MSNPVIATTGLTRRFGDVVAVDHVTMEVPEGAIYGFLGPNGAGKSTTIRLLLGLIRPNAGDVTLFGEPLRHNRIALLRRVGALVEGPSLYPHLTGRENLEVTRRMIGGTQEQRERALKTVRLEDAAGRLVRTYSTGMKQRLALALAIISEPDLLILDEPTSGLDPAGIREIRCMIAMLPAAMGVTIFLSSHLLGEVEQMATHIGIIHQGKLRFQGTLEALQAETPSRLALEVDRPQEALEFLRSEGWPGRGNGARRLLLNVNGPADGALINTQLVAHGFSVSHLDHTRPTLEDVFLAMTEEHGDHQAS
jgi:ABC-2 type transport system ATP-binding protein